jgi:acyl phosphate:glycerol-3-phosphate acyltransferase
MVDGGIVLCAFVAGSIPFSNLVARFTKGVDLRDTAYGTVSGTSVYRVAGFWALVVSGILDVAKGALAPALAGDDMVLAAIAGGIAVVGHNWSPFLRGKGGRGIAPALGALAVIAWPGVIVVLGCLVLGKAIGETGLGGFAGEIALAPVLALTNGACGALAGGAVAVPMLAKRMLGNGRPQNPGLEPYLRRLLFDRDPGTPTP